MKFKFISLRFCKDKLQVIFKRSINERINCYGFGINVLDDFVAIGRNELYNILAYYDISEKVFRENIRAENYTKYHLAEDIGCNLDTEQPELRDRLKLNQMNEMESLANIGLKYHSHYIDYSRYDDYGNPIPEYEIEYDHPIGVSYDKLKRDISVLEPDIRPKEQTTLDTFLISNPKAYTLIKGYLPIPEFSIESNRSISRLLPLECNNFNEFHDFIISEKAFSNRKIIPTKFILLNS